MMGLPTLLVISEDNERNKEWCGVRVSSVFPKRNASSLHFIFLLLFSRKHVFFNDLLFLFYVLFFGLDREPKQVAFWSINVLLLSPFLFLFWREAVFL